MLRNKFRRVDAILCGQRDGNRICFEFKLFHYHISNAIDNLKCVFSGFL